VVNKPPIPKRRFADAVTYPTSIYTIETDGILDRRGGRGPNMPVVSASHFAARQYTKWLSKMTGRFYRLPTEAEWEYACRAGTTTAYSFGDDPKSMKYYGWDFDQDPDADEPQFHPVGQRKPNAWGLHDMHGNAAEWCIDQFSPDWYAQFAGRKVKASETINWPTKRYPCVIRGGSYESEPEDCRSAARLASDRQLNAYDAQLPKSPHWESNGFWVGFRVVSPVKEPSEAEKRRFWNAADDVTLDVIQRDREVHELTPSPPKPAGP
jgi:formylglycine-generating enzyme required for sulfatase activity